MNHGSKLSCYGVPGDGCGGGREFVIENGELYALDPVTGEKITLLEGVENAYSIEKKGCRIFIMTIQREIVFNLSTFKVENH